MGSMKYVVGFSGGADSQACLGWCRDTFGDDDVIALNSNAGGNEHPLTEEFIRAYSASVFPVTVVKALFRDLGGVGTKECGTGQRRREFDDDDELTFDRLAYVKGRYPSRKAQFCTQYLKLAPQRRWCEDNLRAKGLEFARYIGVRRDESSARSCLDYSQWDGLFGCMLYRPLADWTKRRVFDYLQGRGEEVNPLYRLGFNRVGCATCINSSKEDSRLWAARFPQMIDKVREWEARVGRTFFAPCVPGKKVNWIDDVLAWSKTARGGKQLALPLLEAEVDSGRCMSNYGLCE